MLGEYQSVPAQDSDISQVDRQTYSQLDRQLGKYKTVPAEDSVITQIDRQIDIKLDRQLDEYKAVPAQLVILSKQIDIYLVSLVDTGQKDCQKDKLIIQIDSEGNISPQIDNIELELIKFYFLGLYRPEKI